MFSDSAADFPNDVIQFDVRVIDKNTTRSRIMYFYHGTVLSFISGAGMFLRNILLVQTYLGITLAIT